MASLSTLPKAAHPLSRMPLMKPTALLRAETAAVKKAPAKASAKKPDAKAAAPAAKKPAARAATKKSPERTARVKVSALALKAAIKLGQKSEFDALVKAIEADDKLTIERLNTLAAAVGVKKAYKTKPPLVKAMRAAFTALSKTEEKIAKLATPAKNPAAKKVAKKVAKKAATETEEAPIKPTKKRAAKKPTKKSPEETINDILNTAKPSEDVRLIMEHLHGDAADSVAALTTELQNTHDAYKTASVPIEEFKQSDTLDSWLRRLIASGVMPAKGLAALAERAGARDALPTYVLQQMHGVSAGKLNDIAKTRKIAVPKGLSAKQALYDSLASASQEDRVRLLRMVKSAKGGKKSTSNPNLEAVRTLKATAMGAKRKRKPTVVQEGDGIGPFEVAPAQAGAGKAVPVAVTEAARKALGEPRKSYTVQPTRRGYSWSVRNGAGEVIAGPYRTEKEADEAVAKAKAGFEQLAETLETKVGRATAIAKAAMAAKAAGDAHA